MAKHFSDEEVKGLVADLVFKLDRTRDFFDAPIVITSGYRAPDHNDKIGGVKDSAHTKGMAVDIRAPQDPAMREKLMWAAGSAGFRRVETAPKHFHFDTDDECKPSPCFWQGDDK